MVSMRSGLKSSFASLSAKQDTTAAMVQQLLTQVNHFTNDKAPLQLSVTVNPAVGSPFTTIPSTSERAFTNDGIPIY